MAATGIQRSYSPEEVDKGLMALVTFGSSVRASNALEEQFDLVIPPQTLRRWRGLHHDRYFEFLKHHGTELEQKAVDTKRALLPLLAEGISLGVEKTIEELEAGEAKDPSASARNLAVISGIETRDLLTLTGRPTEIRRNLGLDELYRKLQDTLAIDGEAEEIPVAEVVTAESAEGGVVVAIERDRASQRPPE